jgi:glucose/mannose transport system substrate-binding protein
MAHGHTVRPAIQSALVDVVSAHFNGEFSAEEAAEEMVAAVAAAR